ncbi:uncharacterized protein C8Q71DRAFT_799831 [Rhodofomes roseus]|uniref:CxC2-like cysteine cluster KDZ transposase-associated domain-containing protein n=1 Tax=Rhodofomes roseus TaxID=34475 RepID=A0ABQ8JY55_9APHY|nr:uncharacterized protein C8Q71DRAFT_799831 [Rhodofomes roseus]KAH9829181.1 hypothetical protein C8Q71DRAFT_799831 [Rhodofomes roseus]
MATPRPTAPGPPARKRRRRAPGVQTYRLDTDVNPNPVHRHVSIASSQQAVSLRATAVPIPDPARESVPDVDTNSALGDATNDQLEPDEPLVVHDDEAFETLPQEIFHNISDLLEFVHVHKRRNRTISDNPLENWRQHDIDDWLSELLRLEGRCGFMSQACATCGEEDQAEVRCDDCEDLQLYCRACTIAQHRRHPFHRVKTWCGTHFRKTTLKSIGLRIQLGHRLGDQCPNPLRAFGDDFVVLDVSGVNAVAVDYCGCETAQSKPIQLLRSRLLPATGIDPKTAATFRLMELYHLLHNQSKVSGFEFYNTLVRRTDNTGTVEIKSRYTGFMRMSRMWMHLKLLKRFGRGHDPLGAKATTPGSCAVLCPACPQPGKNLPDGWETSPPEQSWLYRLFLGMDANFRLKRKKVSSDNADPGFNNGIAYFVNEQEYKTHLEKHGKLDVQETSTCSNHDAVKLANMRGSHGTAASGVATVECIRHDMKRPCSVGDLQKGERYVNMDYLFSSSIQHHTSGGDKLRLVVSYDIACQWSVNLWDRMLRYDPQWDYDARTITFLIPKFHLPAHQDSCQTRYSFNYVKGVGRTDGEAVERGWAAINGFSGSTKEMGPGSRRDVLDDAFGDYNWRKVTNITRTLMDRMKDAVGECSTHAVIFDELTSVTDPTRVTEWKQQVEAWEEGAELNPFVVTRHPITLAAVRRELAEEEATSIADGSLVILHDKVSPSTLITAGLELEEAQRRLRSDAAEVNNHSPDDQRANIIRRRNLLQIQELYMPHVVVMRSRDAEASSASVLAENISLYLPSSVAKDPRISSSITGLLDIERRLRLAQANDSLDQMRRHLRARTKLYNIKDQHVRGQRYNTRSRAYIDTIQAKIDGDAERYRVAHAALLTLDPDDTGKWQKALRPLARTDVRAMHQGLDDETEGRKTLSWIWRTSGSLGSDDDEDDQEAVRIEWCKARARAMRWDEECDLLYEEMRRVRVFFEWHVNWWMGQIREDWDGTAGRTPAHAEGRRAYAHRQADIRRKLLTYCNVSWRSIPEYVQTRTRPEA